MTHLTSHQSEAVRRVEEAFVGDAREVEVGVPGGFGRLQVVERLAEGVFGDARVLVVVPHPARIAQAFESGLCAGGGRRVGLVLSESDVEVASLPAALRLALAGRLSHGALVLDGLRPDQDGEAEALVRACGAARVVRLCDAPGLEMGEAGFPVRVVAARGPDPAHADPPGPGP